MDKALKQEYQALQYKAKREAAERRQAAFLRQPRLKELAERKRALLMELGTMLRDAEEPAALRERTLREIAAFSAEEDALLHEMGMSRADLEPRYECERCRDTGFADGGQNFCACYRQKLSKRRAAGSRLDERETFERFDPGVFCDDAQRRRMAAARSIAERYADSFPECERMNLVLIGPPGQGKTYLLNCVAHRVAERGFRAARYTAYGLVEALASAFREGREAPGEFLQADLLCIDDLGTEPMMKNITREYIFSILNERQNAGRGTAVATNLPFGELQDRYGERVLSRLISPRESSVMELKGPDIRLKK